MGQSQEINERTEADGPFCSNGLSLDTPIYRIHRHQYLKELLARKLVLPATTKWDDPYENLISCCAYEFIGDDGKIKQVFLGNDRMPTFGQCWTKIPESDAIWRIYSDVEKDRSPDSSFSPTESVRLRTTARKLVNALVKGMGIGHAYFANAVGTYRDKAFAGISGHADALLMKRSPFAHEHGARLLYIDSDREFQDQGKIEVPIDVNDLIQEITLDPRLRIAGGEGKRKDWLETNGFKNIINTSLLYQKLNMLVPLFKPEDIRTS